MEYNDWMTAQQERAKALEDERKRARAYERKMLETSQLVAPTDPGAWEAFGDAGMIWLCNRILGLFGWQLKPMISGEGLTGVVPERLAGHTGIDLDSLTDTPGLLAAFLRDNIDKITEVLE